MFEPDKGTDWLVPSSSSRSERLPKVDLRPIICVECTEARFEGTSELIRIELSTLKRLGATSSGALWDEGTEGA